MMIIARFPKMERNILPPKKVFHMILHPCVMRWPSTFVSFWEAVELMFNWIIVLFTSMVRPRPIEAEAAWVSRLLCFLSALSQNWQRQEWSQIKKATKRRLLHYKGPYSLPSSNHSLIQPPRSSLCELWARLRTACSCWTTARRRRLRQNWHARINSISTKEVL